MRTVIRRLVVGLSLLFAAAALNAGCDLYECKVGPDSANCWIRFSGKFASAATCQGMCDCMPDPSNGNLYCSCYCRMDYCYSA